MANAKAMDIALWAEVAKLLGLDPNAEDSASTRRHIFLAAKDGGMGFQSIQTTAPAAHAASWHVCLPRTLRRLDIPTTASLQQLSPWARKALPEAQKR